MPRASTRYAVAGCILRRDGSETERLIRWRTYYCSTSFHEALEQQ